MQNLKKIICELTLPFIITWFFMTVLVDVVAIPTVFRNSSSIIDAGKIGMSVFGKFNYFEIFFSTIILIGVIVSWKFKKKKLYLYFAIPLFFLSLLYTFYMTPKITELTYAIVKTDVLNPEYAILQAKHAGVHNQYRFFDSVKLFGLFIFAGIVLKERVQSNREIV